MADSDTFTLAVAADASALYRTFADVAAAAGEAADDVTDSFAEADATLSGLGASAQAASGELEALAGEAGESAHEIESSFAGAFAGVERAILKTAETGKFSFADLRSIAADLLSDIAGTILQGTVGDPLSNLLAGLLPHFAEGGGIAAGQPALVGERGPELFVPGAAGAIVPNAVPRLNRGTGPSVVVNQTINVTAGVAATVRAEMLNLLPAFKRATMAAVIDAQRRTAGGLL